MEIRYINNNEDMKQKAYFNTVNSESFREENRNLKNIYRFMAIALRAFGALMVVMYFTNNRNDPKAKFFKRSPALLNLNINIPPIHYSLSKDKILSCNETL